MIDLSNKTALICGATSGIGLAIAMQFAKLNARVILVARNEDKLKSTCQSLANENLDHFYLIADFNESYSIDELCKNINKDKIDIVINNTGGPPAGPITAASPEEFLKAYHAHLVVNHKIMLAVISSMKANHFGRIINIISTSVKQPLNNLGVSNTTRAAVANWAKTLSKELAPHGITVNNILPGATYTGRLSSIIENNAINNNKSIEEVKEEMLKEIPMNRFAQSNEIAYSACFLASDLASYITGINLPIDGGRTLSL
ncbi:MAG: hypothetical protein RLZZ546_1306 [Bacteroidota bacterium]|jgi:3-oxoacyl-[acyl-carrier protein] reductase